MLMKLRHAAARPALFLALMLAFAPCSGAAEAVPGAGRTTPARPFSAGFVSLFQSPPARIISDPWAGTGRTRRPRNAAARTGGADLGRHKRSRRGVPPGTGCRRGALRHSHRSVAGNRHRRERSARRSHGRAPALAVDDQRRRRTTLLRHQGAGRRPGCGRRRPAACGPSISAARRST